MIQKKHLLISIFALILSCLSTITYAQTAGKFYVTTGWLHLSPQESSDPLFRGSPINSTIPNTGSSLDDVDTFGFSLGYFFTDHISTDLVLGVPPRFKLSGTGILSPLGVLGHANQWSPTLLFKYHFNNASARLRPYIGVGATYIWFSGATITNPRFSGVLGGPTNVSISRTWAPVFNAGLSYSFNKHWFAGLSISYIPASIEATMNTQTNFGTITSKAKIKINPIVTYFNVGYLF